MLTLKGSPSQIGREHAKAFPEAIRRNLSILVWREGYDPLPRKDKDFVNWRKKQEILLDKNWPWLLKEMSAVAETVQVSFEDILLLNLRAWQFEYYGATGHACSSMAITLNDGTVACAGALDESLVYLCGPVCFKPDNAYSFITLPFTGTSWALRGINEKGLSIGISSQILPGLRKCENTVNGDLAIRVLLQTCKTADEARGFCKEHPFTMNLVCVDAKGGIFCAHQTSAGLFELPVQGTAALTNHIVEISIKEKLIALGSKFSMDIMPNTTFDRLYNLYDFCKKYNGTCTSEEVMKFISHSDTNDPGSINNEGTAFLTFADPQKDPKTFWIMEPRNPAYNNRFKMLQID